MIEALIEIYMGHIPLRRQSASQSNRCHSNYYINKNVIREFLFSAFNSIDMSIGLCKTTTFGDNALLANGTKWQSPLADVTEAHSYSMRGVVEPSDVEVLEHHGRAVLLRCIEFRQAHIAAVVWREEQHRLHLHKITCFYRLSMNYWCLLRSINQLLICYLISEYMTKTTRGGDPSYCCRHFHNYNSILP